MDSQDQQNQDALSETVDFQAEKQKQIQIKPQSYLFQVKQILIELTQQLINLQELEYKNYYSSCLYHKTKYIISILQSIQWSSVINVDKVLQKIEQGVKMLITQVFQELQKRSQNFDNYNEQNKKFFDLFDQIFQSNFFEFFKENFKLEGKSDFEGQISDIFINYSSQIGAKLDFLCNQINSQIKSKKLEVKSDFLLQDLQKNELCFILWLGKRFNELVSLSFEDFSDGFWYLITEIFDSKYGKLNLQILNQKLKFLIDSEQNGVISFQMMSDFFHYIFCDSVEQKDLFSNEISDQDSVSSSKLQKSTSFQNCKLKITLLKKNEKNQSFQENQVFWINQLGYQDEKGISSKNGSVRIGRQSNSSPVLNDINFPSTQNQISRRQLLIFFKNKSGFKICDTSTSNPTSVLLEKDKKYLLTEGKQFTFGKNYKFNILSQKTKEQNSVYDNLSINQEICFLEENFTHVSSKILKSQALQKTILNKTQALTVDYNIMIKFNQNSSFKATQIQQGTEQYGFQSNMKEINLKESLEKYNQKEDSNTFVPQIGKVDAKHYDNIRNDQSGTIQLERIYNEKKLKQQNEDQIQIQQKTQTLRYENLLNLEDQNKLVRQDTQIEPIVYINNTYDQMQQTKFYKQLLNQNYSISFEEQKEIDFQQQQHGRYLNSYIIISTQGIMRQQTGQNQELDCPVFKIFAYEKKQTYTFGNTANSDFALKLKVFENLQFQIQHQQGHWIIKQPFASQFENPALQMYIYFKNFEDINEMKPSNNYKIIKPFIINLQNNYLLIEPQNEI